MANINPNSTNYFHSYEPNTNDLTMSMDYDFQGKPVVRVHDTNIAVTNKRRQKVSNQELIYFNTYQFDKDPDIWDESVTGTASSTLDVYLGNVLMAVAGTAGDQIIRQTRRVLKYIPGRENEVSFAIRFQTPVAGIRRRLGVFDGLNGMYFEDNGGVYSCVIRRNTAAGVVETRVTRDNWNIDKLDGLGPSTFTADPTKQQMISIVYDWYGAGSVTFQWLMDGKTVPIHTFHNANLIDTTWTATVFLPIRLELTNVSGTAGNHYMWQGSASVSAEGSTASLGIEKNAFSPITGKTTGISANTFVPMLSIRLKSTRLSGVVIPTDFQAATLDNTTIFYQLRLNATLTGPTWTSVSDDSYVEYSNTSTALTGGTILQTGYLSTYMQGQFLFFDQRLLTQLGRTSLGTVSDTLTVAIASTQANKAGFASMNWIEVR